VDRRAALLLTGLVTFLQGCQLAPPPPGGAFTLATGNGGAAVEAAGGPSLPVLSGRVDFPETARKTQATTDDVIKGSTLSLVDPVTNKSISSTISRADGTFDLVPPGSMVLGTPYILEGVKGVKSGNPGGDAVRLRSFVILNGGSWDSISSPSIVVDALTTAVAVTQGLFPGDIARAATMSKVQTSGGVTALRVTPSWATHPDLELLRTSQAIRAYAAADRDPVHALSAIKPALSAVTPAKGKPGDLIRLTGTGFHAFPGGTQVFFGTATASILLAEPESLVVAVPDVGGDVKVTTAQGASGTLGFAVETSVPVVVTGIMPAQAIPGQTITVFGQGFDRDKTKNKVFFGFTEGTITVADSNSLIVQVPNGAASSQLSVVAPQGTSNAVWFEIPYRIDNAPKSGLANQEATITGMFPADTGEVRFGSDKAEILSWTASQIDVVIPSRVQAGAITVLTSTGATITGPLFTPKNGNLSAWSNVGGTNRSGGNYMSSWQTGKTAYLKWEGETLKRIDYAADGGVAAVTDAGGLGLPSNHAMKGGVAVGNWAYYFNPMVGDYNAGTQPYYRAPINSDGVFGNFSSPGTFPLRSYINALKIKTRIYLFNMIDGQAAWAQLNADGSLATAFTRDGSGEGYGNRIHGDMTVVGGYLFVTGGESNPSNVSRAQINANGTIGSWNSLTSTPVNCRGASTAQVGKYFYVLATEQNNWWRADILAGDTLSGWTQMPGSIPNTQYHADKVWVKGDYAYHMALNGLNQARILD